MAMSALRHCSRVFGIGRRVAQRVDAALHQLLVVELHAVGGLVLDPVPERLELRAVQHGLPRPHLAALVGVLDLQPAGELAQDLA